MNGYLTESWDSGVNSNGDHVGRGKMLSLSTAPAGSRKRECTHMLLTDASGEEAGEVASS